MGAELICNTDTNLCVGCVVDTDCAARIDLLPREEEICVSGCWKAAQGCQAGTTCCGSSCFDTTISIKHCGSCANDCTLGVDPPASCGNGVCNPGNPVDPDKPTETCESCPVDCDCHAAPTCKVGLCGLGASTTRPSPTATAT